MIKALYFWLTCSGGPRVVVISKQSWSVYYVELNSKILTLLTNSKAGPASFVLETVAISIHTVIPIAASKYNVQYQSIEVNYYIGTHYKHIWKVPHHFRLGWKKHGGVSGRRKSRYSTVTSVFYFSRDCRTFWEIIFFDLGARMISVFVSSCNLYQSMSSTIVKFEKKYFYNSRWQWNQRLLKASRSFISATLFR